ncbi:2Fe-2S iron-sulfur cluster binding domain-containing protein [bacterium]|nr:MAG: 2Fe-2S iron-sulfur cluster binding domain-containing protein [bacterium]
MSKKIGLTIDGKEVKVPEGTNLIEAAETIGIHIPNLCYLKGMRGIGACRLCLVEVEGGKGPVVGCITRVKEGMVVNTTSEKLQEMRKFVIDLILSMHPLDCMTCTKAGACNLQQYAYDFELQESNFSRKKFGYPTDEANPFIKRDPEYCILCARCVRVCKEQGTNVLDFMGRGVGAKVVTAMDRPLQDSGCTFCGSCVDACPVNALLEADRWRKGREWEYGQTPSVCLSCGDGCEIVASTKDSAVVKVNAGASEGSAEKYICAVGRFGFDALTSDTRVTTPLKRVGKGLKETTWEDALGIVAGKLKKSGKNTGIIASGSILNQDAAVLSKFASNVVKTKHVDTTVSQYAGTDTMQLSDSADMDAADVVVLVGLDPSQWERVHPALDAVIRKRVARGAKLIVINSGETRIASSAAVTVTGDEASALAQVAKSLIESGSKATKELESELTRVKPTEESAKAAELITGAHSPVLLSSPSLFHASRNLSLVQDIKVVAVPLEANARGVIASGLKQGDMSCKDMVSGSGLKALYVVGETPGLKKPKADFLVVQTSFLTDLAKKADVVLPAAASLESKGTVTDYLGRSKNVKKVISPSGDSKQHKDIIIDLAESMGKTINETAAKPKTAGKKTAKAKPGPFKKQKEIDIKASAYIDALFKPVVNCSKLLWLKETEKTVTSNV